MKTSLRRSRTVLVNRSFAPQRVTGQQRYAAEIAARLSGQPHFSDIEPRGFWAASTLRVWAWLQLVLPISAGRAVVLSLTARAPLWRRRHVLVVHDLFVLTHPEWYSRRYVWTHALLLRAQLRSAAAAVAVSQPVANQLAGHFRGPVVVAPNAPSEVFGRDRSTASELSSDSDALTALQLTTGRYLLAVGNLDPRKNLPKLAHAYGLLSVAERAATPLVVVGGGAAIYRDEKIDWPSGTVHAGYVSDDELRQLYAGARAVVFVSLAEGFGLPLVEAAAAGVGTLVISDIPVFRWICADGAHYVDPRSVSSIAAGLRAAISEPRRLEIDLDRFTWEASARAVADLCLSVAGRAPDPGAGPERGSGAGVGRASGALV